MPDKDKCHDVTINLSKVYNIVNMLEITGHYRIDGSEVIKDNLPDFTGYNIIEVLMS